MSLNSSVTSSISGLLSEGHHPYLQSGDAVDPLLFCFLYFFTYRTHPYAIMSRAPPPPHWVSDMHPYPPGPGYHGSVKRKSAWEREMKMSR